MLPLEDFELPLEAIYPNLSLFLAPEYLEYGPEAVEAAIYEASGGQYTASDLEAFPIIPLIAALAPLIPTIIQGVQSLTSRPAQPAPPRRPATPPRPAPAPRPQAASPRPAAPARPALRPAPRPSMVPQPQASSAPDTAMQLLTTLTALLPQVLQAVGSLATGRAGSERITIGERQVPVEGVVHMLKTLSEQLLEQRHNSTLRENAESMEYLRGEDGQFLADPADPVGRAQAVYQTMLGQAASEYTEYGDYGYEQAYDLYYLPGDYSGEDDFFEIYDDVEVWGWGY